LDGGLIQHQLSDLKCEFAMHRLDSKFNVITERPSASRGLRGSIDHLAPAGLP
jgi:hypothetical protein